MQNRSKRPLPSWLSWLLVVLFIGHFGAILIYQFGMGVVPKPVAGLVDRYVLPWFFQNYTMFAPDPDDQLNRFVYRTQVDGTWSPWKDPVYPHYQRAWYNRFGTGTDVFRILDGIGDGLYNGVHYANFLEEPTDEQWWSLPGYQVAERYVRQSHGESIEAFEVGVLSENHRVVGGRIQTFSFFWKYPLKELPR